MSTYSNGLSYVGFGTIQNDGGPASTFTELGSTVAGSFQWTSAEGTATEFFIEESEDPILRKTQSGSNTVTWQCADVSPQVMQQLFGGTVTGDGSEASPYVYAAPANGITAQEKSLKFVSGNGLTVIVCRASVFANLSMAFAKDQVSNITITATILKPSKVNEPAYKINYAASIA